MCILITFKFGNNGSNTSLLTDFKILNRDMS